MRLSVGTSRLLAAVIFTAAPAFGWAGEYDITAFPGEKPVSAETVKGPLDCPIESLATDSHARAVIDKDIPGLLSDRRYPMFKTMSLRTVAAMSSGRISKATLRAIDSELEGHVTPAAMARDEARPFRGPLK